MLQMGGIRRADGTEVALYTHNGGCCDLCGNKLTEKCLVEARIIDRPSIHICEQCISALYQVADLDIT